MLILIRLGFPSFRKSSWTVEQVAFNEYVKDEEGKSREDLVELQLVSHLKFYMSMSKIIDGMNEEPLKSNLRYVHLWL